mmetsp:Transcript_43942/g.81617  ORF Transcript_43942/g.81617 Transcript_43942/m.81617 type:complete len:473 (-) Transcript_43942:145-1563(-)
MAPRSLFSTCVFVFLLIAMHGQEALLIESVSNEELLKSRRAQVTARVSSKPRLRLEAITALLLALNPAVGWQGFSAEHLCGGRALSHSRSATPRLQVATEVPSITELKVYELKAICRAKGLKVTGKKTDLIQRIEAAPEGIQRIVKQPRPKNAWMLFLQKYRDEHATKGVKASKVAAEAGAKWKMMTEDDKASFLAEAETLRSEYNKQIATPALQTPMQPFASTSPVPDASQVVQDFFNAGDSTTPEAEVFKAGGTTAEVEVLTAEDAVANDVEEMRAARRARRNERLKSYFSEEYTKVQGELQALAGSEYSATFDSPKIDSVSLMGIPLTYSVPSRSPVHASVQGHKLAWCRSFDAATGIGVLVSLDDKSELSVPREALKTSDDLPMTQRKLYPGEFVQYDPLANKSAAAGIRWVSGVSDWPLMCQTCADQGLGDLLGSPQHNPDPGNEPKSENGLGNLFSWMQGKDNDAS